MRPLRQHLLDLLGQVPPGQVVTFRDLAEALGDPVAARAVGQMMRELEGVSDVPTHRVVRSDGTLGGDAGVVGRASRALSLEGVAVDGDRLPDLEAFRFRDLKGERPLEGLREEQLRLRARMAAGPLDRDADRFVGVDVAYTRTDEAFAAAVEVDGGTLEVLGERVVTLQVEFPYVPTYLTFRELPPIEAALEGVELAEAILLVDGQGVLHPRGFGIACHAGVVLDVPTVGVAKRLLCGGYDAEALAARGQAEVVLEGSQAGWALAPPGAPVKPVYVSPGHAIGMEEALGLAKMSMGKRQPLPLELAHAAATRARRRA